MLDNLKLDVLALAIGRRRACLNDSTMGPMAGLGRLRADGRMDSLTVRSRFAAYLACELSLLTNPRAPPPPRIDGAGGDLDAPLPQLFVQQRLGDLTMMMLIQQIAAQRHAKVMVSQMRRQIAGQIAIKLVTRHWWAQSEPWFVTRRQRKLDL
jgi:hypothetical protein